MRAAEARRRRTVLGRAQARLDGQVGIEAVAPFVGQELCDVLVARVARRATEILRSEGRDFADVLARGRREGKLVVLSARWARPR